MKREEIIAVLQTNEELAKVPSNQLEWLINHSEIKSLKKDEFYIIPGQITNEMVILLKGHVVSYSIQNNQKKELFTMGPAFVTGRLPFSRMKAAPIYSKAKEDITYLSYPKEKFKELISNNYELIEAIVHIMSDRIRTFASLHFQSEKLISLGKLSAGLAHELNNPASAIVRSASVLKDQVGSLPQNFKDITSFQLNQSQIDFLNKFLQEKKGTPVVNKMNTIERQDREDELRDYLEQHHVQNADGIALSFMENCFSKTDLEQLISNIHPACLEQVLDWINTSLITERTVNEIAEASRRINKLVSSIRNYTYMDKDSDKQDADINEGIRNTLTMLQHKFRKNNVKLMEELKNDIPKIKGFPGALNQLWTNLIDNALDAMEEGGGELKIKTFVDNDKIIISIKDKGTGIPQELMDKIFDPFYTTKDVGKGTGIGLDIVKRIIEMHHGSYKINSKIKSDGTTEHGTEFLIYLPTKSL